MKQKKITADKFKKMICAAATVIIMMTAAFPAHAMDDGAYIVTRTTSYANPETGQTVDGGTNIALGDSMCAGIVEQTALVEQSRGKTYVTIGIGLMSNISDTRIQIQGNDGTYRDTQIVKTGSCQRDGDTCNHYRFEVDSAQNYISPILFVDPMGRNVQFFIKLNMDSAQPGNGNFVSEMVFEEVPETEPPTQESSIVPETSSQEPSSTEEIESTQEISADTEESKKDTASINKNVLITVVVIGAAAMIGAGTIIIYKKRKK